jgi:putative transposase
VPWRQNSPMSEKKAFVRACTDRRRYIAEICAEFGISEKTGYRLLKRYRESGEAGLEDRSHAVRNHPFQITEEVERVILSLKHAHPDYGPQVIHDRLRQHEPFKHWPAASSIGELLKRHGLVKRRRRRDRSGRRTYLNSFLTRATEPNLVWTADFKGEFKLNSGAREYCYPLTVMDLSSRFILGIRALHTTSVAQTRKQFTTIFREYGLPRVIRSDNGVPFAHPTAIGRLGQLALWWVRLGIRPEHIRPGTPSENGAHERFHKTLKAAATKPASPSLVSQQQRFDDFRDEYNNHRPHRSLDDRRPPRDFYLKSPRVFPERLPSLTYPERALKRRVTSAGTIRWHFERIFISSNMAGDYVGILEEPDNSLKVLYGNLELGTLDSDRNKLTPGVRWRNDLTPDQSID